MNLRCASIVVNFENGYDILVAIDDVKLINSGGIMQDDDIYKLYDRAIMTAIYRTGQHNLFWDKSWVTKLDI